ncbi:MAG: molybdate ABC transporter substrate-binding protein, partial [Pseudomonadales bacterium]|nr:molybdate ABC transporter substrate-binding protein [Pseudomonadales bacterium]
PEKLIKEGLADKESSYIYALGQLALWSAHSDKITRKGSNSGEHILSNDDESRLVIPNPKLAPYGFAAVELMKRLKVYHLWQKRLITAQNVAQAQQFILSGSVPFGFIPLSQINALPPDQRGSYWQVPASLYPPIVQRVVLLEKGRQNPAAAAFLEFLKSAQSRKIIRESGYLPEPSN